MHDWFDICQIIFYISRHIRSIQGASCVLYVSKDNAKGAAFVAPFELSIEKKHCAVIIHYLAAMVAYVK